MLLDNLTIKHLFNIHDTQLRRYRTEGLRSVLVEVFTNGRSTSRRLYDIGEIAHHIANRGHVIPKGLRDIAKWDAPGIVTPMPEGDDDPGDIPLTPDGKAFILGYICGAGDMVNTLTEDHYARQRLDENQQARQAHFTMANPRELDEIELDPLGDL